MRSRCTRNVAVVNPAAKLFRIGRKSSYWSTARVSWSGQLTISRFLCFSLECLLQSTSDYEWLVKCLPRPPENTFPHLHVIRIHDP